MKNILTGVSLSFNTTQVSAWKYFQDKPCSSGSYFAPQYDGDESKQCPDCPLGLYRSNDDNNAIDGCLPCPENTYAETSGKRRCTPCPPHSESSLLSAKAVTECKCQGNRVMVGKDCVCGKGYGYTADQRCDRCRRGAPFGEYKDWIGDFACVSPTQVVVRVNFKGSLNLAKSTVANELRKPLNMTGLRSVNVDYAEASGGNNNGGFMDISLVFDDREAAEVALAKGGMQRAWSKASDALPGTYLEFDPKAGVGEGFQEPRTGQCNFLLQPLTCDGFF